MKPYSAPKSAAKKRSALNQKPKGLFFRKDLGSWVISKMKDGCRVFKCLDTDDYATAVALYADFFFSPALSLSGTVKGELELYIAERKKTGRFRDSTERTVRDFLRAYFAYADNPQCNLVTDAQAQAYWDHLLDSHRPSTARSYFVAVRGLFTWLVEKNKLRENPFAKVELPDTDIPTRLDYVEAGVFLPLIAECERDDVKFILYAGFMAGMRKNEIINAAPHWFDLEAKVVRIISEERELEDKKGKVAVKFKQKDGEALRLVPMTDEFVEFMRRWNPQGAYCLAPEKVRQGRWRYRYDFNRPFSDYLEAKSARTKFGKKVSAHIMRHSFASWLVQQGVDLFRVSAYLGDDYETTQKHYAHLAPSDRTVEAALRLARKQLGNETSTPAASAASPLAAAERLAEALK